MHLINSYCYIISHFMNKAWCTWQDVYVSVMNMHLGSHWCAAPSVCVLQVRKKAVMLARVSTNQANLESAILGNTTVLQLLLMLRLGSNAECVICEWKFELLHAEGLSMEVDGHQDESCGWHALLECECKHPCETVHDDGYKKLNRQGSGI